VCTSSMCEPTAAGRQSITGELSMTLNSQPQLKSQLSRPEAASTGEMTDKKRDTPPAPEDVLVREHFLLDAIRRAKHTVDRLHLFEAFDARRDRKNVVLFA